MGTVGLSFGSPTSGAGFDVASTVASIVSNLQNVETPWKNQLTSLQSQDTVLSNLGTLFSNLSNDLSQLTDFQGVLAQKTGSSSDTNVLELTSASSAAIAGTHTVTVSNLAQTSSGYIDAVGSASDPLAGSISIAIGGGSARTFNISDLALTSQNLTGLAAAINAAGIGVNASVLTDSNGSRLSLVSATSGRDGQLSVNASLTDANSTSVSNPTGALGYNDAVDGKDATLTIDGLTLQSASNTVTNLIPGITFQVLSPSSSGAPVQVVIGNDNSSVESKISSMVSDYNALINAINGQEGNDSSGNPEPLFGSPTISLLQQQLLGSINSQNPSGYLDPVSSASDTLAGSITIQAGDRGAHTITVDSTDNTLSGLAAAINSAGIGVTANLVNSSTGLHLALVSNTVGSSGKVTVSSSLTDTTSSDNPLNFNMATSDINALSQLGISVNNDGTLTLDSSTLDSLLNADFAGVVGFFQGANSWGMCFSNMLSSSGDSASTGILKLAEKSNGTIESNLNASISREESLIAIQKKSLTAELNQANEILQALPSQLNSVNEIYAAITGYNQQQNG